MRKILRVFKAITLTSTSSLVLTACGVNQTNQNYVDISNIKIATTTIAVNLDGHITYNAALNDFRVAKIETEINKLITTGKKAEYGADYKITITNHNLYEPIHKEEVIDINVNAATTTHILKGNFTTKVRLIPPSKDISDIKLDKQTEEIKLNTTTFEQAIAYHCLSLITNQLISIAPTAKQDFDYVVNVEGHQLTEHITTLDVVNINVTAIEDNYHFLLHGSFSFMLAFVTT